MSCMSISLKASIQITLKWSDHSNLLFTIPQWKNFDHLQHQWSRDQLLLQSPLIKGPSRSAQHKIKKNITTMICLNHVSFSIMGWRFFLVFNNTERNNNFVHFSNQNFCDLSQKTLNYYNKVNIKMPRKRNGFSTVPNENLIPKNSSSPQSSNLIVRSQLLLTPTQMSN